MSERTTEGIVTVRALLRRYADLCVTAKRYQNGTDTSARVSIGDAAHAKALEIENVLLALLAPEPAGWQPIETAPRDGSWFLVYCADTEWRTLAQYTPHGALAAQSIHQQTSKDPSPTHWCPLPSFPPTKEAKP